MSSLIDAVNDLLVERGSSPVQTLQPGHPYSDAAIRILEQTRVDILDRGWWFNRDIAVQLTPDTDDTVAIPNDVLRLDGKDTYSWTLNVDGGRILYDRKDHTTLFTENPDTMDLIRDTPWERLPNTAYSYIVAQASEKFCRPNKDALQLRQLVDEISRKLALLVNADLDNKDVNTQTGNPLMVRLKQKMKRR